MKLKRLTLQGYKTFASKTDFVFDEGITAVVGPNGSGKSNIADALRWVLGEQSYSTLRGKRTTDMIFAGSQSRSRAGMAQAILTLDNNDGWLPIDYTEVEIGRRAFRSGENEYILNGQKVRLKDVVDLLATSGLAERTYTFIGQGLVDQALALRSEERRALFEEAAGINHYKSRRAETLRRLEETHHNLERVHDILAEIRPRLTSLKRQATRAQNYEQIAADLRHLLRIWYGHKWEQAKVHLRQRRQAASAAESTWRQSRRRLLAGQEKIDKLRRRINQAQEQTAEIQAKRDQVREQLEQVRRQVAVLKERQQSIERQLAEIEAEMPILEEQQAKAQAELAAATAELQAAHGKMEETEERLQQFNAGFQAQQAKINHWQQRLRQSEEKRRVAQTGQAQAQGQLRQLQEQLQEPQTGQQRPSSNELEQAEAQVEQHTAAVASAQAAVDELRQRQEENQAAHQALVNALKQRQRAAREQEQRLNQHRRQMARLEARVELLDQMHHTDERVGPETPVIGRLASLITIPDPYQAALEAALAARLAALVVPDEEALWHLMQNDGSQPLIVAALAHIQPAPKLATPDDAAVIGWADEVVAYDQVLTPVVRLLLGRVLLVEDERVAYRQAQALPSGALAVTPGGFVAHAGGLVETNGRGGKEGILAQEKAWRQAKDELEALQDQCQQLEATLSEQQTEIERKQADADERQGEEQQLARLRHEANQRLSQEQRRLDRARQQRDFLTRQAEAQVGEAARLRTRIQEIEQTIQEHSQTILQMETAVSQAGAALKALPMAEAQQQQQNLAQKIETARTIVAGRQAVVDSRRSTFNQVEYQLNQLKERQTRLQAQQQDSLQGQEAQQRQLQQQLEQLEAELRPLRAGLAQSRQELTRLEEETAGRQRQTHELETQYTQARVQLTQQENQVEGLQERIKADLGLVALSYDDDQTGPTPLPISEVVEQLPQVEELPDDIEESIHAYRGQMQRMGAINPDAPAEYEETQTRHDFLSQQIEDLNQTELRLRRVINELDALTSRAFAETVEKVNAIFGQTFEQLFGGGRARLVLTDPDDLTTSGVEIVAQLPNRREQGLGLLSGGERSLTAAALIFSLLKVSPTPFCVLDEVDAALDEANVNRFRELLRELSLKTQFVIITHNRGTVQAAQTIYGISMGADSTSEAISVRPETYVKQGSLA